MSAAQGKSLPRIAKVGYLTSNDDNAKFRQVYGERVDNYNQDLEKTRKRMVEINTKLKEIDAKEKEINGKTREELESGFTKENKTTKPAAQGQAKSTAKTTNDKDKTQPTTAKDKTQLPATNDKTQTPATKDKNQPPATNEKNQPSDTKDKTQPKQGKDNLKSERAAPKESDPLDNIHRPTLDPRMSLLLPLYKEKRKLKDEYTRLKEKTTKIQTKKSYVKKKDEDVQVRENILSNVHVTQEYIKNRKTIDRNTKSLHRSMANMGQKSTEELQKLKQLRKGFYLDILENTSQVKTAFNMHEKKYNIDHIILAENEHKKDQDLKYRQAKDRVRHLRALDNPEDPQNNKFLKESGYTTFHFGDQAAIIPPQDISRSPGRVTNKVEIDKKDQDSKNDQTKPKANADTNIIKPKTDLNANTVKPKTDPDTNTVKPKTDLNPNTVKPKTDPDANTVKQKTDPNTFKPKTDPDANMVKPKTDLNANTVKPKTDPDANTVKPKTDATTNITNKAKDKQSQDQKLKEDDREF